MREFRDAEGVEWSVFFTARSVARDQSLPEEYREGWLAFESSQGAKRRLAPVPKDWDSLGDEELSALCGKAAPQTPRKKAGAAGEEEPRERAAVGPAELSELQPQLGQLESKLSTALGEICELPPPGKLNTGELIRVEETLALATETAKEAVSLRRRLRADRDRR